MATCLFINSIIDLFASTSFILIYLRALKLFYNTFWYLSLCVVSQFWFMMLDRLYGPFFPIAQTIALLESLSIIKFFKLKFLEFFWPCKLRTIIFKSYMGKGPIIIGQSSLQRIDAIEGESGKKTTKPFFSFFVSWIERCSQCTAIHTQTLDHSY